MMTLPSAFIEAITQQLGSETDSFLKALDAPPPVSIRANPFKKFEKPAGSRPIAWMTESVPIQSAAGYYLPERPIFTLDPTFHAGAYYVQEASSMFIAEAVKQLTDTSKDLTVLDLCAAPGGKTTLLNSILSAQSCVVANEVIRSRVDILKENVIKWGQPNVYVTNHDPDDFTPLKGLFDIVLVDAPCSGEGLFRKDPNAVKEWSVEAVQTCSARQKRILHAAAQLVKPEGLLLYSTCTYNDFENNENVEWLIRNFDYQLLTLNIKPEWQIVEKKYGYQFYPHRVEGEGFFLVCLKNKRKGNIEGVKKINAPLKWSALPKKQVEIVKAYLNNPSDFSFYVKPNGQIMAILKQHLPFLTQMDAVLQRKSIGVEMGEIKGNGFIPSHNLALSTILSEDTPSVKLTKLEALQFLKKENVTLNTLIKGWCVARYAGNALGWMKILPNRINNYLPNNFRIRMDLPK